MSLLESDCYIDHHRTPVHNSSGAGNHRESPSNQLVVIGLVSLQMSLGVLIKRITHIEMGSGEDPVFRRACGTVVDRLIMPSFWALVSFHISVEKYSPSKSLRRFDWAANFSQDFHDLTGMDDGEAGLKGRRALFIIKLRKKTQRAPRQRRRSDPCARPDSSHFAHS